MRTWEATVLSGRVYLRWVSCWRDAVGNKLPITLPVLPMAMAAESPKRDMACLAFSTFSLLLLLLVVALAVVVEVSDAVVVVVVCC